MGQHLRQARGLQAFARLACFSVLFTVLSSSVGVGAQAQLTPLVAQQPTTTDASAHNQPRDNDDPPHASPTRDRVLTLSREGAAASASTLAHERILAYAYEVVWSTAIRHLRVDRRFTIADRDEEAGFILFEFPVGTNDDGTARLGQGSLELFRTSDPSGRQAVNIRATTSSGPLHLPHALVEGLAAKLVRERGQPPPPPAPPNTPKRPAAPGDDKKPPSAPKEDNDETHPGVR